MPHIAQEGAPVGLDLAQDGGRQEGAGDILQIDPQQVAFERQRLPFVGERLGQKLQSRIATGFKPYRRPGDLRGIGKSPSRRDVSLQPS